MKKRFLREEIKEFQNKKKVFVPIVLFLGMLGLVLPVIPGVALLFLGFVLVFPRSGDALLHKMKKRFSR